MAFIFKRGDRWYIRYKDEAGEWHKVSCGENGKKADAEYLASQYTNKEMNRRFTTPVRVVEQDVQKALEIFRDQKLREGVNAGKEESSINREQTIANIFLNFLKEEGLTKFKEIDEGTIRKFADKRLKQGCQANTRIKDRRVVYNFFKWTMERHYCVENPVESLERPKRFQKPPRYFSEDELKKIIGSASERYKKIYTLLYLTGMREGEISNLEWRDYNRNEKFLTIRVMSGNKTKREETIPLNEEAVKVLTEREKEKQNDKKEMSHVEVMHRKTYNPKAAPDIDRYIFVNEHYNKLDPSNIYRNLKWLLKEHSIIDASPHTFRHTCASHLVIKGVSIYTVRDLLRHRSVKETEIYAHLSKKTVRDAVDLLKVTQE